MSVSLASRLRKQADELNALADLLEPRDKGEVCLVLSDGASLADRIERRLEHLGMSARSASLAAIGSPDLIRNILRAARDGRPYSPRIDTLQALASVLGCSPSCLIGDSETEAA